MSVTDVQQSQAATAENRNATRPCRECGTPATVLHVSGGGWGWRGYCLPCAEQMRYLRGGRWDEPKPCAACGFAVAMQVWRNGNRSTGRRFCCAACESRFYRKPEHHSVSCAGCGEQFTATRSDSRYCSNKCRQKAYRERAA